MKTSTENKIQVTMDTNLLTYLGSSTQVCNRLHAFIDLLQNAVKEPAEISKRGISIHLAPGQLEASIVELSIKWKWHRKTVASFLDELESHGYIKRMSSNVSTIIELTCLNRCAPESPSNCPTKPASFYTEEVPVLCTADFLQQLPGVAHQDPPMRLSDEIRQSCKKVYDLFIKTFPLLDEPEAYNECLEKDIYYVFILGMKGDFSRIEKYFGIINADPFKNGTMAAQTGISSGKVSFQQLFSTNWQLVFDCDAENSTEHDE